MITTIIFTDYVNDVYLPDPEENPCSSQLNKNRRQHIWQNREANNNKPSLQTRSAAKQHARRKRSPRERNADDNRPQFFPSATSRTAHLHPEHRQMQQEFVRSQSSCIYVEDAYLNSLAEVEAGL